MAPVDPRAPCLIGVAQQTWHPDEVGDEGAPEPLAMWEDVARLAADDTGVVGSTVLDRLDDLQIVYCQTWQYDDPSARLAARLGVEPRHTYYSGIGGTTPQVLVDGVARRSTPCGGRRSAASGWRGGTAIRRRSRFRSRRRSIPPRSPTRCSKRG